MLESDLCSLSVSGRLHSPPDDGSRDIQLFKSSSVLGNNKGKLFLNKTKENGLIPTAGTQGQSSKTHRNLYEGKIGEKKKKKWREISACNLQPFQGFHGFPIKTPYGPKLHRKGKTFTKQW